MRTLNENSFHQHRPVHDPAEPRDYRSFFVPSGNFVASSNTTTPLRTTPFRTGGLADIVILRCVHPASGYQLDNWSGDAKSSVKSLSILMSSNKVVTANFTRIPMNGVCGSTINKCLSGKLLDSSDSKTEYRWTCQGLYKGKDRSCLLLNGGFSVKVLTWE